jgi:NADPH-dependent 2,4-dienoyl-CoA reductase/sulfur reductase-like enzyme
MEAGIRGADVTVVERLEHPGLPWELWPELLARSGKAIAPVRGQGDGAENIRRIRAEIRNAGPGFAITTGGEKLQADSLVVATGCCPVPTIFAGCRKKHVAILDGARSYSELGRRLEPVEDLVVSGEGYRGMEVADRLASAGRRVRLLISNWQGDPPGSLVKSVLADVAEERGVSVSFGNMERAAGSGRVEAVVVDGKVTPCQALLVVPRWVPRVIPMPVRLGRFGGIVVDGCMMTSEARTYAAGGCAEVVNRFAHRTLEGESRASGRIAGANSAGGNQTADLAGFSHLRAFGLRWTRTGIGPSYSGAAGTRFDIISHRWDRYSACTIIWEGTTGRVWGVETVEPAERFPTDVRPLVSGHSSLKTLAYEGPSGSSDISLVSDTARLGLKPWSRS